MAGVISNSTCNEEIVGLNPRLVSSITSDSGHESRATNRRNGKPFPAISKAAMKSHLFRLKPPSTQSRDAKRVSQLASPLDQTWYKERDGWRWVERDVDGVLAELRKLR